MEMFIATFKNQITINFNFTKLMKLVAYSYQSMIAFGAVYLSISLHFLIPPRLSTYTSLVIGQPTCFTLSKSTLNIIGNDVL